jgi:hypothetical protein
MTDPSLRSTAAPGRFCAYPTLRFAAPRLPTQLPHHPPRLSAIAVLEQINPLPGAEQEAAVIKVPVNPQDPPPDERPLFAPPPNPESLTKELGMVRRTPQKGCTAAQRTPAAAGGHGPGCTLPTGGCCRSR